MINHPAILQAILPAILPAAILQASKSMLHHQHAPWLIENAPHTAIRLDGSTEFVRMRQLQAELQPRMEMTVTLQTVEGLLCAPAVHRCVCFPFHPFRHFVRLVFVSALRLAKAVC